jgi:tRNA (adenine22-N1)-methyltransferase
MAGMGALTMIGILSEGLRVSRVPRDLVLQPMNAVETLRRWLHENGWGITAEGYGREAGGIWPVFRASAGAQDPAERFDYLIGNWEMASGHPLFREYLKQEIERCGRRLTGAAGGKGSAAARRAAELADRMIAIKELSYGMRGGNCHRTDEEAGPKIRRNVRHDGLQIGSRNGRFPDCCWRWK